MEGRWGLTLLLTGGPLAEHGEYVKQAEAAGYTDLWSGETAGPDGFTPLALSAAWTERVRLGTGIVGGFPRGPAPLPPEGGGPPARRRQRRALRPRHRLLLGPDHRRLDRHPLREASLQGPRDARIPPRRTCG